MKHSISMILAGLALAAMGAAPLPASAQASGHLGALLRQAEENNPDIQAARREVEAARNRISPAAAFDDPMLEAGIVNLPANSFSIRREDMTMKMIGFSQRLPYPGKRALRRDVAEKEAEAADGNYRESLNRVRREVKIAYYDLAQVDESQRIVERNRRVLEQFLSIAETRYSVGSSTQADVFKAQTQLSRMLDEIIKLGRERPAAQAELDRALGQGAAAAALVPDAPRVRPAVFQLDDLRARARQYRPQLLAQESLMARSAKALDLARKDYYPDFDVRVQYGQRDNFNDLRREDLLTFTVAINLPIWRESKRDPRVAEAIAMREQAERTYQAKLNEVDATLRQQVVTAEQSLKSVRLYETGILPQSRLAVDAALSAYRVGRSDFLTLLDSQMNVFNFEVAYLSSVTSHNKALAEIEFLTGKDL